MRAAHSINLGVLLIPQCSRIDRDDGNAADVNVCTAVLPVRFHTRHEVKIVTD